MVRGMTQAQYNAALLRRAYQAFTEGDMGSLTAMFTEDAVWHVPGGGSLSGVKRGRDAVIAYFGELLTRSCGTLQITLHDVVAGEEHTVGLHHDSAERNGEALDQNVVLVVHLRDGQFAE